ncbi:MAG TPA: hypothetical protein VFX61_17150, partial [Micromonosporaceae bacterium]|nr:hypothetical protein [Micromonosporaceae bacterium]
APGIIATEAVTRSWPQERLLLETALPQPLGSPGPVKPVADLLAYLVSPEIECARRPNVNQQTRGRGLRRRWWGQGRASPQLADDPGAQPQQRCDPRVLGLGRLKPPTHDSHG